MPEEHDPELETTRETPVGDDPEVVAGRYRIVRTLGRGGGGIVWLAHDQHLGREVALKRVAGEPDAEALVTRGLREARTSAALAHHHVVRVYDAFVHEGSPWIVMEYVPGPSLSALLEGGRALPVRQVARIGAQVATALAAAHGAGVVHRDIKPGNVLLTDETGQDAKLSDFGIARAEDDHQLTRTGMVSGTAAYFSPELARGGDPSAASDVWALGATLYAAVEGRRPYPDAGNPVAQLHMIARDAPEEPRRAGPLEPVLRGLLDPDPAHRWTAEQAARALTEVAESRPVRSGVAGAGVPAAGGVGAGTWAGAAGPEDRTQRVASGTTRQVPVGGTDAPRRAPSAPGGDDHAYAAPAAGPRPAPRREVSRSRAASPRPRRRSRTPVGVVLGWVLGLLLALLLGWLLWTIASGDLGGGDGSPTATATEGQPVSVQEAEGTVRAFYAALQDEGLAAAREHLVEGVPVDEAIADGLDSVGVSDVSSTELDGGVVQTVATATYTYGACVIVQDETVQVARRGTEALIVRRVTETVSTTGCREESVETGAGDDAADRGQSREDAPDTGSGDTDDPARDNQGKGADKSKGDKGKDKDEDDR